MTLPSFLVSVLTGGLVGAALGLLIREVRWWIWAGGYCEAATTWLENNHPWALGDLDIWADLAEGLSHTGYPAPALTPAVVAEVWGIMRRVRGF